MPSAPPRPCPTPHCRRQVTGGGRCAACRSQREQARGSAAARGYTAEWAAYSRAWLSRYPFCGQRLGGLFHMEHSRCAQQGERTAATVTDHILAIKAGGAVFDPINHQSLCGGCNRRKGIAHEGGFSR